MDLNDVTTEEDALRAMQEMDDKPLAERYAFVSAIVNGPKLRLFMGRGAVFYAFTEMSAAPDIKAEAARRVAACSGPVAKK